MKNQRKSTFGSIGPPPVMLAILALACVPVLARADEIVITVDSSEVVTAELDGATVLPAYSSGPVLISSTGSSVYDQYLIGLPTTILAPPSSTSGGLEYPMASFPDIAGKSLTVGSVNYDPGPGPIPAGYDLLVETNADSSWSSMGTQYPDGTIVNIGLTTVTGVPVYVAVEDDRTHITLPPPPAGSIPDSLPSVFALFAAMLGLFGLHRRNEAS